MAEARQNFGDQVPDAATNELERAGDVISANELEQAISDAALYIDAGYGLYIAGNESAVTAALRDLERRLERANDLVESASAPGDSELDRARRQAQDLRAQLQQLAQNGEPAQDGQQGQQAQDGQQGQNGQQGGQQQGGNRGGAFNNGGRFGLRDYAGTWDGYDTFLDGPIDLPDNYFDNLNDLTQLARGAVEELDLSAEELAALYDLIRELEYQQTNRNESILAQQYGDMLALIEQLEAGLDRSGEGQGGNVRTANSEAIPEEFKDSVAEYFRRLSRE
jgi:hypothetical protein